MENATCLRFVLIIYEATAVNCYISQTIVSCYRADKNHCHWLQDRHKPLSPVTELTQTTVTGYKEDTNHCHRLQDRHKPLSLVTG